MSDTVVTTSHGALRGTTDGGIDRYLGIPYAATPFGPLRFAPPQPPTRWAGERDATAFGATAPQAPYAGPIAELLGSVSIAGSDILTANVWAPAGATALPVVLWIHGGALERGTAALSIYDGTRFAESGVVFVSINYRLGSEGFSVFDGSGTTNVGVRDCAAGLRWVYDEIAAFGGDPARITVMGESAGGAMVAALASNPASRELMAGAIIQSGPLRTQPHKKAARVTRAIAKEAAVAPSAGAFAQLTPEQLVAVRSKLAAGSSPLGGAPGFQVVVDDAVPESPHVALKNANLPILIGSNTEEYRLWFTDEQLAEISAVKLFAARTLFRISRAANKAYQAAWPGASTGEMLGHFATDLLLRRDAIRVADDRVAPTFVYEFAWQSPVRNLRACHALEIGFAFNNLSDPDAVRMAGSDAPQALADDMHAAWVSFIKTGDAGWDAYDERRLTRVFDVESRTVPLRRADALDQLPD